MIRTIPPKKLVVHPLSCWDIISFQFLTLPQRWDLAVLEKKRFQYSWQIDFPFLLKNRYHSFVVIDTFFRICCKSKKFDHLLKISGPLSESDFVQSLREGLQRKPVQAANGTKARLQAICKVEIFPLNNLYGKRTHFFVLMKLKD